MRSRAGRLAIRAGLVVCTLGLVLACSGGGRAGSSTPAPESAPSAPGAPAASTGGQGARALKKRPPIADPSNLTEAEVDALAQWLIPFVEQAGGARFSTPPKGLLGTPANLAEGMALENREIMGRIYDLPPSVIQRMAEGAGGGVPGLLGKYMTDTGAVYLVPQGIAGMAEGLGSDTTAIDVATLIMAHELGHALQDQVADLDTVFDGLKDLDHFDGMAGITEGQANWITLRVARELGLEEAFWTLSKGQGWSKDGLETPGAFPIWMRYGQGMAFCEHHAEIGGTDRLWELVRHPPRSSTMILRPERYAREVRSPREVSQALAGVEQALTRTPDWVVADTHLGEANLRKETLGLDAARVEDVLGAIAWGHERRLFVSSGGSVAPRNASVMLIGFDDAAHALALVELLRDGLTAQAQARTELERELASMAPGVAAREWTVEVVPEDGIQGDAVMRRVVGPTTPSGARSSREEEQSLWVVRGTQLVVVTVSGFRPGNRLDKAVEQLFTQIDAADLSLPDEVVSLPE